MKTARQQKKTGRKQGSRRQRYPFELKVRAVKLYLEEEYSQELIVEELGVGKSTLTAWVRRYREQGEAGLRPAGPRRVQSRIDPAAKAKAVELKQKNPEYGIRRISNLLRRVFLLKASAETVRRTLHEAQLIEPAKPKPKKNPSKPRFFERATPNQLWQSDIFTFRLGGRAAYLIGFLDDYSRYVTGLGLYRSQTAEHVLEVYRQAVGEYGVPKEMLTDQGRQYTNWRGTTRFEAELQKERVRHIKSRAHHPMTLGKIERFWKTIWTELLSRAQFESFEEAGQRVGLWVKYFNHKRPHQGIGGLCPADRYFEIQHELRKVLEAGVEENVLEQALRGRPQSPFYMVGRLGEQSVVIRAEKGKVRMQVDGDELGQSKELVYQMEAKDGTGPDDPSHRAPQTPACESGASRCEDQMRGSAFDLVGTAQARGDLPGAGDQLGGAQQLAEQSVGGDDAGAGHESTAPEPTDGIAPASAETLCEQVSAAGGEAQQAGETAQRGDGHQAEGAGEGVTHESDPTPSLRERTSSPPPGRDDSEGSRRRDERAGRGPGVGSEPQDLLQVGTTGAGSDDGGALRAQLGPSSFSDRRRERSDEAEDWGVGEAAATDPGTDPDR
jgi:transposase InsO family protein